MEIEVQEDFLSFEADLVAEQLTYMDAVSGGKRGGRGVGSAARGFVTAGRRVAHVIVLTSAHSSAPAAV